MTPALQRAEITEAKAFLHLWRSIDVAITRCPVCERQMRANWAWCPCHADPQQLRNLFDQSATLRDAPINEGSFLTFLQNPAGRYKDETLADHLQSPYDDFDRLLVHWTEFDVLRQRDA